MIATELEVETEQIFYGAPATVSVVVPSYNWAGFYVGINGGYGFGRSKWDGLPATLKNGTLS